MIAVARLALLLALAAGPAYGLDTVTPAPEPAWGTKDTITLTVAIIGAVTGCIGALLGGINTWHAVSARKVRVLVKPTFAYDVDVFGRIAQRPRIGIEVINLSAFAVTVTEVGFTLVGTSARANPLRPTVRDDRPWPCRLEARESVSTYCQPPDDRSVQVKAVYAQLATGERFTRSGKFVKSLREAMAEGVV